MERIMTVSVIRDENGTDIRGQGECMAVVNGVVQEELRKQQLRQRAEVAALNEQIRVLEARRNRLLGAKMAESQRNVPKRPNVIRRGWDRVRRTFEVFMAIGTLLGWWGDAKHD